jgi:hypothetical protein
MNTDFQRHADLWDSKKMSRLIESILIRLPLPAFYFDASKEDKWLIVDGLQRLASIKKFIIDQKLKLRGLEYLTDLNGTTFGELSRTYKRRIDECSVTLFLIQPGTPEKVKYSIFRRINTGGLVLNDQEIRNAMTTPKIREFISELTEYEYLKKTIGDQSRRMMDQEMVLRYLAFFLQDYENSKKNITTFLDEMLNTLEQAADGYLAYYKNMFFIAIKRCWDIFGADAFEKRTADQDNRRKRKNSTLFEVWTNALGRVSDTDMQILIARRDFLIQRHIEMMTLDNDYFRSITYSTQKREHYIIRKSKVNVLIQEVLNA